MLGGGLILLVLGIVGYYFSSAQLAQYQTGLVQLAIGLGSRELANQQAMWQIVQIISVIIGAIGVALIIYAFYKRLSL
jgi:energy-converting hydrogenase Eha subunit E